MHAEQEQLRRAQPLAGLRVIEFAAIGPAPFAAMMLADMGAEVLRISRPGPAAIDGGPVDILARGRTGLRTLDLKQPADLDRARAEIANADVLIEGFRPDVMERLGLGPDEALALNPRLVYGRVTGWGREGPLAQTAGHDINYLAVSGALGAMGPAGGPPQPPLNLVGDFGGGGMLLAFGVMCALQQRGVTGRGQVVDAAMLDGAALLAASIYGLRAGGRWDDLPGTNFLDGSAPFYRCYACADGGHVAVGAIEPQFYGALLRLLNLADDERFAAQWDRGRWPELCTRLAAVFIGRSRDDWACVFEGSDACVTPVLRLDEVAMHPQNQARAVFSTARGYAEPAPAPRFPRA